MTEFVEHVEEFIHDVIHVHVDNAHDMKPPTPKVEEKEPEHFVLSTVTVAALQAGGAQVSGYSPFERVLDLDPLRKDASILAVDQPIVLCHSRAQTTDPANQVVNVPFPQGAYLPAGSSLTVTGTGRMWAVAVSTTPGRVSIFTNRRDK